MSLFNPHILKVESQNTDWGEQGGYENYGACEDQPNDAGRTTLTKDGQVMQFKSILFVAKFLPAIPEGSKVQVFEQDGTTLRLEGTVTRFSNDFFRNRLWVL